MRRTILLITILGMLFILGCEVEVEDIPEKGCIGDSDCITGGCSGTICQSKDAEPIFTTCEYLPEYACYKQINCGCVENKCEWEKTTEFEECVLEARETLNK